VGGTGGIVPRIHKLSTM